MASAMARLDAVWNCCPGTVLVGVLFSADSALRDTKECSALLGALTGRRLLGALNARAELATG